MEQTKIPKLKYSFKGNLISGFRTGDLKYKYSPFKNLVIKNETLDNLSCILNDTAINTNTEKVLIETLTYLKNDFDFIFAISQSSYVNLPQTIKDFTYRILLNIPDSKNTISNHYGVPYRYAIEVYLASIESLISFWVMNGAQESPEEMTSIILKMLYIDKYFNKTSL